MHIYGNLRKITNIQPILIIIVLLMSMKVFNEYDVGEVVMYWNNQNRAHREFLREI